MTNVTYLLPGPQIDDSNTAIGDIGAGFMSLARVNHTLGIAGTLNVTPAPLPSRCTEMCVRHWYWQETNEHLPSNLRGNKDNNSEADLIELDHGRIC
jgi:hypothetical protein